MSTEHRMLRFVYGGKNYVGPVNEILAPTRRRQRRILDCGTGSGLWLVLFQNIMTDERQTLPPNVRACEMADEFPHAQVIGVDVAPIQPEYATSARSACVID
jgi:ubiquinone/menaquinone biosynthesis C-methylase UbiE